MISFTWNQKKLIRISNIILFSYIINSYIFVMKNFKKIINVNHIIISYRLTSAINDLILQKYGKEII
jgi:hypothetical protein